MPKYSVKINTELIDIVNDMLDEVTLTEIGDTARKIIDPWVPFLEGPLSQTAIVDVPKEQVRGNKIVNITYIQPYARYQYYGVDFNHTTDYHPLASALWDKEAMKVKGDQFNKEVNEIILKRL